MNVFACVQDSRCLQIDLKLSTLLGDFLPLCDRNTSVPSLVTMRQRHCGKSSKVWQRTKPKRRNMLQIADNASKFCRYYEDAIFRLQILQSALCVPSLQRLQRMHSNLEHALDEHGIL